jgi:hypothetical protein
MSSAKGEMQESLKTHDKDMDARLNKDEFVEFARVLVKNGVLRVHSFENPLSFRQYGL